MDVDKIIRWAIGFSVTIVISIAAFKSYQHIAFVSHNPLLAFSIDGMIITSTLVIMAANRARLETVQLAYVGLWLGIAATLAANVLYGLPSGLEAAVWSTWPAICFVVSVETIAQWSRRKRKRKPVTAREAVVSHAKAKAEYDRDMATALTNNDRASSRNVEAEVSAAKAGLPTVIPVKPRTSEGVLGLNKIGKAVNVGTPEAKLIQAIMVRDSVDVYTAKKIRDREKHAT